MIFVWHVEIDMMDDAEHHKIRIIIFKFWWAIWYFMKQQRIKRTSWTLEFWHLMLDSPKIRFWWNSYARWLPYHFSAFFSEEYLVYCKRLIILFNLKSPLVSPMFSLYGKLSSVFEMSYIFRQVGNVDLNDYEG